jgi:small-conductance mechanosensitive channel
METLERLTRLMNVFVRFFESLNCLFWQLGWLQQNITQSSLPALLTVGLIMSLCVVFLLPDDVLEGVGDQLDRSFGLPQHASVLLLRALPLVIVAAILFAYVSLRMRLSAQQEYAHVYTDDKDRDPEDGRLSRHLAPDLILPPSASVFHRRF